MGAVTTETPGKDTAPPVTPGPRVEVEDAGSEGDEGWVSLKQASAESGLSVATLRKWYRKGRVESREVVGEFGPERRVRLAEILERAAESPARAPRTPKADKSTTLAIPAERLWAMYQEAGHEAQQARERAAAAEAEAQLLRNELERERSERERLTAQAIAWRPRRWWRRERPEDVSPFQDRPDQPKDPLRPGADENRYL
jgi:lambda repressor-like predicted transcriptional regulator